MADVQTASDEIIRTRDSSTESGREGTVDVELLLEGQRVSRCRIVPLRLRIATATARMDGIGLVETSEEHRHRGYARRVLNHALQRMQEGDAALTMLYGIQNFYPKFGYITAGPESTIALPPSGAKISLPEDYQVRAFMPDDLPSLQRLYDRATARSVGAAVRAGDEYPWTEIRTRTPADCRVVADRNGRVTAYVWRGEDLTFVRAHSEFHPDDLILGEVVAADGPSADAALAVCRAWAAEEAKRRPIRYVRLFMPHEGPVAAAAMQAPAELARGYESDGGWMASVLSTERLFSSLQPELSRRLIEADNPFRGALRILTDAGDVTLSIGGDGVQVENRRLGSSGTDRETLVCRLPQTTLARLTLGTYPSDDLLARLPEPPEEKAVDLLRMMFPVRPALLFLADRF